MIKREVDRIVSRLTVLGEERNIEGMARYGIRSAKVFGVKTPHMKDIAREHRNNQELAEALWLFHAHETRMIATLIADPERMSEELADTWVHDLDNWAICDGFCFNLVHRLPFAYEKCFQWCEMGEEFVRRAAFSLMAKLCISHKSRPDSDFQKFFPLIQKYSSDERQIVRKAVNWSLRQIGKKNIALNEAAIQIAQVIEKQDTKTSRWIARDALRELTSAKIQQRLALARGRKKNQYVN